MANTTLRSNRVGTYQLLHGIAAGGMGRVYLARRSHGDGALVAMKVLTEAYNDDPRFVEMLMIEAAACASLRHPNIVGVSDFGEADGMHFIVMEYIAGQNLREVLHRLSARATTQPIPLRLLCGMFADAAKALAYMHGTGRTGPPVIHRDISLANLMLGDDGQLKIIDLGVARSENGNATTPGVLKGKFAYMAPEYVSGGDYDHRIDIWSFGVVMFEFLSRRRLFRGETSAQVLAQVLSGPIPRLDEAGAVPSRLADIVAKALSRDLTQRYNSALELAADLAGVRTSLPQDDQVATLQQWMATNFAAEAEARRQLCETAVNIDYDSVDLDDSLDGPVTSQSQTPSSSARRQRSPSFTQPPLSNSASRAAPPPGQAPQLMMVAPPPPAPAPIHAPSRWLLPALLLLAAVGGIVAAVLLMGRTGTSAATVVAAEGAGEACRYREAGLDEIERGDCKKAGELFNRALKERCDADDLIELYKMSLAQCDKQVVPVDPSTPEQPVVQVAKVLIASSPKGAAIQIDGVDRGVTPTTVEVPFGRYEIRLTATTGDTYEETLVVDKVQNRAVSYTFEPPVVAATGRAQPKPAPRSVRRDAPRPPPPATDRPVAAEPRTLAIDQASPGGGIAASSPSGERSPSTAGAGGTGLGGTAPGAVGVAANPGGTSNPTPPPAVTAGGPAGGAAVAPGAGSGTAAVVRVAPALPRQPIVTPPPVPTPTGAINVDAKNVSGGEIYIDGVRRGREPMTIKGLPLGPSNVEIRVGGRVVAQRSITVKSNTTSKWSPL